MNAMASIDDLVKSPKSPPARGGEIFTFYESVSISYHVF